MPGALGFWQTLCRKWISYGDFQHTVIIRDLCGLNIYRQAALNSLLEILKQLLKSFTLGSASRYGRNFSPIAAFFCFVNNDFNFHSSEYKSNRNKEASI